MSENESQPIHVIHQAYRFALAPTPAQEAFLSSCCGASRFWFNQGLALVKERLDQRAKGAAEGTEGAEGRAEREQKPGAEGEPNVSVPWSYKSLCSEIAPLKDEVCPWRREVVVGSQQAGLESLGRALQNFSKARKAGRRVGFPRYRAKGRSHEAVVFQRPRIMDGRHVLLDSRLGPIRVKEPMRKLVRLLERDPQARILRSTVQRAGRGSGWFIAFTVERSPKQRRPRQPQAAVGVDLGLARLATLSTGEACANSRPLEQALAKLRRCQRKLDRQRRAGNPANYLLDGRVKPGRKTWAKSQRMLGTEGRIARLHARVANLRRERSHELTTKLTRHYGAIGVESLAVANLLRNRRLARHIADAGWGLILQQLAYKTDWSAGSMLVAADPYYPSSKTCSGCGTARAKLSLSERVFACADPACGLIMDRDLNAALNLAHVAAEQAQAEGREVHVAAIGAETLNARGGQVRLDPLRVERSPRKCEASSEASQRCEALAVAALAGLA